MTPGDKADAIAICAQEGFVLLLLSRFMDFGKMLKAKLRCSLLSCTSGRSSLPSTPRRLRVCRGGLRCRQYNFLCALASVPFHGLWLDVEGEVALLLVELRLRS
jgi:hypothetical protein